MNIEPLTATDGLDFAQFFAIYEQALPAREQKPKPAIINMCHAQEYTVLLAKKQSVLGFAIIYLAPDKAFCLLEYMAIAEACRGSGFGQALFIGSYHHISLKQANIPMLIELDSVRELAADANTRARRQGFYSRLGCRQLSNLDYIMPLPGQGQAPMMDLLVYQSDSYGAVKKHQLRQWLQVIYQQVYQCCSNDARIDTMLTKVSDPLALIKP